MAKHNDTSNCLSKIHQSVFPTKTQKTINPGKIVLTATVFSLENICPSERNTGRFCRRLKKCSIIKTELKLSAHESPSL